MVCSVAEGREVWIVGHWAFGEERLSVFFLSCRSLIWCSAKDFGRDFMSYQGAKYSGKIFLICSNGYRWIAVLIRMPYITLMLI